jgi:KaiC/GvpD/RAD55 family RecA-like ATPase
MRYQVKSGHELPEHFEGWLWDEAKLLPRGEMAMVIGHDGVGKTTIAAQMVAEWTQQDEVVFLSMLEDGEGVIKSKLLAAGADLEMCVFQPDRPDGSPNAAWAIPDDLEVIEAYLRATGATVAVFDSLDAHLTPSPISHRARLALADVHGMAQRLGIVPIFLHHFNKGGTKTSIDQAIGGARGIKAAFRNILVWGDPFVGADFEGGDTERPTHALAVHKNSYGPAWPHRPTMVYSARQIDHPYAEGETVLRFELIDSTPLVSPADIYGARHAKQESVKEQFTAGRDIASEAILGTLTEARGWTPAGKLEDAAIAAGACQRTVKGTRAHMCRRGLIEKRKKADAWEWRITPKGHKACAQLHSCTHAQLHTA